jgi:4-alpha-glucanotransferase
MSAADARSWGIEESYWDISGNRREPPATTIDAILRSMRAESGTPAPSSAWIIHPGEEHGVPVPGVIITEDGGDIPVRDRLPPDLPLGYHQMHLDGGDWNLIVSPGRCHLPAERIWGWAAQVYSLRSTRSWGIGDLSDLRRLVRWATKLGAGMTLINPLHAVHPAPRRSPYFAGSRVWRNPLYISVEEAPGAAEAGVDLERIAEQGRKLNDRQFINRREAFQLKDDALRLLHERFTGSDSYDRFCAEGGDSLEGFATFCALAEEHGLDWRNWPSELRDPTGPGPARARDYLRSQVDYHRWLQWLLDEQVRAVSAEGPLVGDLAIGVDPNGPDAWLWQRYFAPGMTVGAPPDDFNLGGQNWGVLAFDPWSLRSASYEPFIRTVRSALRHAGGIRYDHVMGLWRLFWIPHGVSASEGTYVRYPAPDLLDIVALESHRTGGFIVGEDLGTVEAGVREEMFERAMLSYKLMWFESQHPNAWAEQALGAITNHDLPTIAGVWSGADLRDQEAAGAQPNPALAELARSRISWLTGAAPQTPATEVALDLHRALASAPCRVLAATIEDALEMESRPNIPGTPDDHRPNWSHSLPVSLDDLESHPGPASIAQVFRGRADYHGP